MNKISYNKHTVKPRMLLLSIEAATLGVLPVLACTGGQTVHFTAAVHLLHHTVLLKQQGKSNRTSEPTQHSLACSAATGDYVVATHFQVGDTTMMGQHATLNL